MTTAATGRLTVAAVVVAAGAGLRLGAGMPKAFCVVGGATLLEHAVRRLGQHFRISQLVVVAPAAELARAQALLGPAVVVAVGGATRQASVDAGLRAFTELPDLVLVHDVARPFVPLAVIDRVVDALDAGADAVVPVVPVVDTVTSVSAAGDVLGTVDRTNLRSVQTPQGFRYRALVDAHAAATAQDHSDDASLVERHGGRVVAVAGSELAFKITGPLDLRLAELVAS